MPKFLRWLLPPSEPLILIEGYRAKALVAPRPLVLPVAKSSVVMPGHKVSRKWSIFTALAGPPRSRPF
jgi:hypothetical protein